ncbi:MAG TPA: branched-chain amino acid ABC transporter permease [Candidatus Nanoarchaeia archaeon]|nr:branched-chain amino acid ABC transporter permease [Candidatus Nanoarchaeia archaeon]
MEVVSQLIMNGIIAGGIYSLIALGLTMVYGILKFINFAHGEIFMIGAYIAWTLNIGIRLPFWLSFILAMVATGIVGYIIEKVGYKPLRNAPSWAPLIISIAISIFFQALAIMIWGAQIKTFRTGEIQQGIPILGAIITPIQITILITSLVLMVALYFFIMKTKTGKAMRAVADNKDVAASIGINVNKTISTIFVIGSALAGAGGVLVGIEQNLTPMMGVPMTVKGFTAAIVGGIGNIWGAVIGGFAIGFIENIGIFFIPSGYKDAISFFVLLLMLIFRPRGIVGVKKEEEVRG